MRVDGVSYRRSYEQQYLAQLETLTAEIKVGMDAIGSNALPVLEASVSKQQTICTDLFELIHRIKADDQQAEEPGSRLMADAKRDRMLAGRIRFAVETLRMLNAEYAALLKHSGDTVRLFAGLCRSYTGQFQAPAEDSVSRRTRWQ